MKKTFDILASLSALIILSPLMIFIALCIKTDGGPIIYKQIRVGINGREFGIFKFRSMVVNADKLGGYSTNPGDKRVTSVGTFIRKTSIDELPQLLNVLLGQMSIIGPRPNVPAQFDEYTQAQWDKRNSLLPGITGIAQSRTRSNATWQQRYDMDIEYVDTRTFVLDIKIIIDTFKQVFFKGGY
jgi:lipopolysaccharide/colanic/teichoic acid biosynthesis glycosyltransferase